MDKKPRKRGKKRKIKKVVREKKKNVPWSNSYLRHHNSHSPEGHESHER